TDPCVTIALVGANCQAHCQTTTITGFVNGDGCCPAGGSFSLDTDCPSVCGNGVQEPGETCDTTIPSGTTGACPTNCDDGAPSTNDSPENPGTCTAQCSNVPITTIGPHDFCCPTGGTPANDPDCSAGCGNGVLDAGELCDIAIPAGSPNACPTACAPP